MDRITVERLDSAGRVICRDDPFMGETSYEYDSHGRPRLEQRGRGAKARLWDYEYYSTYHQWPGLRQSIVHGGGVTWFGYDFAGRMNRLHTPGENTFEFEYDDNGNVTEITPPDSAPYEFSYTPVNLLETYTPPLLQPDDEPDVTMFRYDRDRNLTWIQSSEDFVWYDFNVTYSYTRNL